MKLKLKNGLRSIVPIHLQDESATRFCMFSNVKSACYSPGSVPVYLNVYDLTSMNGYLYWAGVGVFHTGVEVYGVEYAFGAHEYPTSGVFEIEPRQCPGFKFRKSIFIGTTYLDPIQIREFMELQSSNYSGDSYHLIMKNCNHFCEDVCYKLTGNRIPKWDHCATAFSRKPSKHLVCSKAQISRALTARREDLEAPSGACPRSQCATAGTKKSPYRRCSCAPTTKTVYCPENSDHLEVVL
nr:deSI-like protein At4g17486 [Ipomoea batatas]